MRNAVQEICCPVERVDNETVGFICAGNFARFFHQEAIAGTVAAQIFKDNFFRGFVGLGDKICRSFARDLQVLHLAKITQQRPRCLARRVLHDCHERGYPRNKITCHYYSFFSYRSSVTNIIMPVTRDQSIAVSIAKFLSKPLLAK